MTVSRVLRGEKYVSDRVRRTVEAAARELAYQADPMLSALSEHRRRLGTRKSYSKIGIINAWPQNRDWLTGTSPGKILYQGVRRRSAELGFDTEIFYLELSGGKITHLLEMLHARGITGLLLLPLPFPVPEAFTRRIEDWKKFVMVAVEHGFGYPNCNYVWTDQFASACMLWDELWQRGYRRIGLELNAEHAQRSHGLWEAAYLLKQNQANLAATAKLPVFKSEVTQRAEFLKWFHRHKPDAIMGKTLQILDWVREEGLEVPGRFGFASFDCHFESGAVAGILQRREEIGETAVSFLFRLLQERKYGETTCDRGIHIAGSWQDGPTVR